MSIRLYRLLSVISVFVSPFIYCQTITLRGHLIEDSNGQMISNGVVKLSPDNKATSSGENGEYCFQTFPGDKQITTLVLGYETLEKSFNVHSDTVIDILLKASMFEINEVTIKRDSVRNIVVTNMGSYIVIPSAVNEIPRVFSEPDLLKIIQFLPGVVSGKDGSADFYVRGGGPGQNVVVANGCSFFLPNHLLGFSSPYDLDFLESAELLKDYIPAEFGGGASSVLKLDYKSTHVDSLGLQTRLGLLSSGLSGELPIRVANLSISAGLKRGNYSLYAPLLKRMVTEEIADHLPSDNYSYYDGYVRVSQLSQWGRINYLFIGDYDDGRDERVIQSYNADTLTNYTEGLSTGWKSGVHAIQWDSPAENSLRWKIGVNYSRLGIGRDIYKETESYVNEEEILDFRSTSYSFAPTIISYGTALSISWQGTRLSMSGGLSNRIRLFTPNVEAINELNGDVTQINIGENSKVVEPVAYVSSTVKVVDKLQLDAGFRLSGGIIEGASFFVIEPRIHFAYNPGGFVSPHVNYVRLSQFDHSLEGSSAGLRSMLWVPVSQQFGPEVSDVVSAGIHGNIEDKYTWTIDGYYKLISGMLDFVPGASFIYDDSFLDLLEAVEGKAWGVETSLAIRKGRLNGFTSYTWSRSMRGWSTPDGLTWIPTQADRPHAVNMALKYRLGKRTSFGISWVFQTGAPATIYMHNTSYGEWFEKKNNIRFFDYHRLDLSLRRTLIQRKVTVLLDLDIYNVYNRKNTFYFLETYDEEENRYYYQNISLFPIMPSISLTLKF